MISLVEKFENICIEKMLKADVKNCYLWVLEI